MNNLRNKVQLIGNLGTDVEFKKLENGHTLARVPLATKEVYKNKEGEKIVDVQWHQLIAWGKVAEIMQVILKKGREIAVEGKLQHRVHIDKTGKTWYFSEVVVNEFLLLN